MRNRFHLAILAGDLAETVPFYTEILQCELGNDAEEGRYQDIEFWGHELTLHNSTPRDNYDCEIHDVEMGKVLTPHMGIHLTEEEYHEVLQRVTSHIIEAPITRYEGTDTEQRTFFIRDPNYNVIEIKYLRG